MSNNKYNVLDLFAGCGGLSNGFEMTGRFDVVAANEFWDPAADTYERNHPGTKMVRGDVTRDEVKGAIYKAFENKVCDVIIGGPPCQAYSNAGFRDPEDPRGRLFQDYVEIVRTLRPRLFVMENVKGLLTIKHERDGLSDEEKAELNRLRELEREKQELLLQRKRNKNNPQVFLFGDDSPERLIQLTREIEAHKRAFPNLHEHVTDQILRSFRELGYRAEFKVLNSANFGVPQKRERVIFIGTLEDISAEFPHPTHTDPSKLIEGTQPWKTVRQAIDELKAMPEKPEWNHTFTQHKPEFVDKLAKTPVGESALGFSDAFHKNKPDVPSRTVKENHGGVLVHYENPRVMTPRELARLQSFGDDFIFEGTKSQVLVQIGNAVPPLLGRAVGQAVCQMLDSLT